MSFVRLAMPVYCTNRLYWILFCKVYFVGLGYVFVFSFIFCFLFKKNLKNCCVFVNNKRKKKPCAPCACSVLSWTLFSWAHGVKRILYFEMFWVTLSCYRGVPAFLYKKKLYTESLFRESAGLSWVKYRNVPVSWASRLQPFALQWPMTLPPPKHYVGRASVFIWLIS